MTDKIKIKISSFVANILENDALRFGFTKNDKSNKNALLNKLIPTLVTIRKTRRDEIENILKNEYCRDDSENIFNAVNTVIDKVYFNDADLNILEEYIWIRPSKEKLYVYDEIKTSETFLTAQDVSTYIRGLLNEYSLLPQYKREMIVFDNELDIFSDACSKGRIVHFKDRETNKKYNAFAFNYYYDCFIDQTNYCIIYDINKKIIKAVPLHLIKDIYTIKQKYTPSQKIISLLQNYNDNYDYKKEFVVEEE